MNNIINNTIDTYISRTNMSTSQEKWIPFSAGQCPSYIGRLPRRGFVQSGIERRQKDRKLGITIEDKT